MMGKYQRKMSAETLTIENAAGLGTWDTLGKYKVAPTQAAGYIRIETSGNVLNKHKKTAIITQKNRSASVKSKIQSGKARIGLR